MVTAISTFDDILDKLKGKDSIIISKEDTTNIIKKLSGDFHGYENTCEISAPGSCCGMVFCTNSDGSTTVTRDRSTVSVSKELKTITIERN
jgi:hypothetical protein